MLKNTIQLALMEAEEALALAASPNIPDPRHIDEIRALGERIGYGNMMATASAIWGQKMQDAGIGGSEFVAGPCRSTVDKALSLVRAASEQAATEDRAVGLLRELVAWAEGSADKPHSLTQDAKDLLTKIDA